MNSAVVVYATKGASAQPSQRTFTRRKAVSLGLGQKDPAHRGERSGRGFGRVATLKGALLVAAAMLALAAYKAQLDALSVSVAVIAIVASLLLPSANPVAGVRTDNPGERQPATADTLLSKIPDPVILVDRRVVVRNFNDAARGVLPMLKPDDPLSFALRAPDVLDGIGEALKTGAPQRVEYREPTAAERTYEVQIGLVGSSESARDITPEVLLFFRDLTSARRLERMRVDFVANASHELRTPLASLLGFIETLQGPARNDAKAREHFLAIMHGQALRMARLVDDLLSLSRIETKVHLQPKTALDLLSILRQILDSMGPLARESGLEIRLAAKDEPHLILGERDELFRVVENLIDNAVKYGQGGTRIDLSLERREPENGRAGEIELTVGDDGPGIAAEHLPRLTERFYRANASESRQKGGTGLGLAIVKHIVARHRGRLQIESTPGHGARFRITFPAALPSDGGNGGDPVMRLS